MKIKALILAGGNATRFGGGDKGLAELAGKSLIAHIIAALGPLELAISANGDPARFGAFGLPVLPDGEFAGCGPLAGIAAGLAWAHDCDALITVPCDTPYLPADLATRLLPAPAYAYAAGRDHFLVASWPITSRAPLLAILREGGSFKVERFTRALAARAVEFAGDGKQFLNINRREDLPDSSVDGLR